MYHADCSMHRPMEHDLEKSIQENIVPKYLPDTGVRRGNQGFFGALF